MFAMEKRYTVPSRKFFAERIIPDMYAQMGESLSKELQLAGGNISFTCDTWTADCTVQSYFGITGHWLTADFTRCSYVFSCMPLDDRHTGQYWATQFQVALQKWKIEKDNCHLVVRDNAANIKKCFVDMGVDSIGCFAHTIQLAVNDGIFSQRGVKDLIATCRKIVGHFKHSSSATARLKELQSQLSLPKHQLIQDVSTRWNSTFFMLERLLEQRQAMVLYSAENPLENLLPNQWEVMKKVVGLLRPFEEATRIMSQASVSTADSIPILAGLRNCLQTVEQDTGVKTMKESLIEALASRLQLDDVPVFTIATLLDPRYKARFFSDAVREVVIGNLKGLLVAIYNKQNPASATPSSVSIEQAYKKPRTAEAHASLFDCVDDLLESQSSACNVDSQISQLPVQTTDLILPLSPGNTELDLYLVEPLIPRTSNCLAWWRENKDRFPLLSAIAVTYLSPPPSSVPSERLFSTAGHVISECRTRLLPENAEKLIMMKYNSSLID